MFDCGGAHGSYGLESRSARILNPVPRVDSASGMEYPVSSTPQRSLRIKTFGKTLSEYASFEKKFLILVLVIGLAWLGLSLAGAPDATVKFASMIVLVLLGLIYYSVWVHAGGHVVAMVVGSLILWGIGSLIMLVMKELTGGRPIGLPNLFFRWVCLCAHIFVDEISH